MAPPLAWRSFAPIDPDGVYVVTTTQLPLRHHRHIPAVIAATMRIARELARSHGLVGYSLHAQLVHKTFWTMSAWQTRDDLERFVRSDVHRAAMASIGPYMKRPRIQTTTLPGFDLPPAWAHVRRALTSDDPIPSRADLRDHPSSSTVAHSVTRPEHPDLPDDRIGAIVGTSTE